MKFDRDVKGSLPLFVQKWFTDYFLTIVEALLNATSSPAGALVPVVSDNNVIYKIKTGGSGSAACQLGAYDATVPNGSPTLGVTWGTIQSRQPSGFSAGGVPAFTLPVSGTGFIYATCTFDLTTFQPTAAQVQTSGNGFQANTSTTLYQMIGSYSVAVDGKSVSVARSCGNVSFDPCNLVPNTGTPPNPATAPKGTGGGLGDSGGLGDTGGLGDGVGGDGGGLTTGSLDTGGLTTGGLTTGGLTTGSFD